MLAHLRERAPALPALICTGYDRADADRAGLRGVRVLHKPFRVASFVRAVRELLGEVDPS